jgi:hypothetical protein
MTMISRVSSRALTKMFVNSTTTSARRLTSSLSKCSSSISATSSSFLSIAQSSSRSSNGAIIPLTKSHGLSNRCNKKLHEVGIAVAKLSRNLSNNNNLRFISSSSGSRSASSAATGTAGRSSFSSIGQQMTPTTLPLAPPPPPPKQKWDLFAGVVLERRPLLSQEMNPLEKEYADLMAKHELEMSKKSDHEVRKEIDA